MTPPPVTQTRAANARLLRRLVLAPTTELVESYDSASPRELVDDVISASPFRPAPPVPDEGGDFSEPFRWWTSTMLDERSGFHERMVWFWHGHLTSSIDKSSGPMMLRQQNLLRDHALSDFRELLRAITLDPAMLRWLDGAGSEVTAPNENYARELMELFALGRHSGAYNEADVEAAAKALAGYWIDEENDHEVVFERESALRSSVPFLGTRVRDVDGVIDAVCDHEACATHVVTSLYRHFVAASVPDDTLDRLTRVFVDADLDVGAVVTEMLLGEEFLAGPALRPRSGLEWFLGYERLVGEELDIWTLADLGHVPMLPPNVAGWPGDDRWISSGLTLTKGKIALDYAWDVATLDPADPVSDVLRRALLYDVSPQTRASLDEIVGAMDSKRELSTLLHAAVAMCPEFSLV